MTTADDKNVYRLNYLDKRITLIGTAHVSLESAELVAKIISQEKPETVCVELCRSRYESMTQKKNWKETDLIKVIKEKKAFLLLSNLMLAYFQKRIGKTLGIKPGEEILRAINVAQEVGAHIHMADRDVRTTLARTWRHMGLWTKLKLMAQFITSAWDVDKLKQEDIEKMKREDVLESLLSEIGGAFPLIRRIIIDERDQYLAHKIRTAPGKDIVAVVGAGHVPGIQKHWHDDIDMESLEKVPPRRKLFRILKWAIPALIIGLIIAGFFIAGKTAGTHMIKWWVLANAVLAGLGAAVAMGHPITVLSAVFASPLTSLNPMIAAGWVSGLVETLMGKPKVRDFENLPEDIASLKGFWQNKITRILLVVVFTNMGSALGTFVAIPLMVRAFA
jgi:pheromone shutdown-related protein TraB